MKGHNSNNIRKAEDHSNSSRLSYPANTPEEYQPMEVPEHIYVAGMPRKAVKPETKPHMVVPSRITVGAGDTTIPSKAQPVEVLRERQLLSSDTENINVNGTPDMLTANELPHEDINIIQQTPTTAHENPHYSSQTSIAVEDNPLKELKVMKRKLNRATKQLAYMELQNEKYRKERTYLWGLVTFSTVVSFTLFMRGLLHVKEWIRR